MTISWVELGLYALGMAGLWAVPGPVWVALLARALSGGMAAAWPLAVGVALGDLIWPLLAILGLSWVESAYGDILSLLRWAAAVISPRPTSSPTRSATTCRPSPASRPR